MKINKKTHRALSLVALSALTLSLSACSTSDGNGSPNSKVLNSSSELSEEAPVEAAHFKIDEILTDPYGDKVVTSTGKVSDGSYMVGDPYEGEYLMIVDEDKGVRRSDGQTILKAADAENAKVDFAREIPFGTFVASIFRETYDPQKLRVDFETYFIPQIDKAGNIDLDGVLKVLEEQLIAEYPEEDLEQVESRRSSYEALLDGEDLQVETAYENDRLAKIKIKGPRIVIEASWMG